MVLKSPINQDAPMFAGCSKCSDSEAARGANTGGVPLGYVEDVCVPRTKLAGIFSSLLEEGLLLLEPFNLTHQFFHTILQASILQTKQV